MFHTISFFNFYILIIKLYLFFISIHEHGRKQKIIKKQKIRAKTLK